MKEQIETFLSDLIVLRTTNKEHTYLLFTKRGVKQFNAHLIYNETWTHKDKTCIQYNTNTNLRHVSKSA